MSVDGARFALSHSVLGDGTDLFERFRVQTNTGDTVITSNVDTATRGPILYLDRASPTPVNGDETGNIRFRGRDSGGNATDYAQIFGYIVDVTDGSEDGGIRFATLLNGVSANRMTLSPEGNLSISGALSPTDQAGTRTNIGLGNVNNTSDANKPISTATQTALNGKLNALEQATGVGFFSGDAAQGFYVAYTGGYLRGVSSIDGSYIGLFNGGARPAIRLGNTDFIPATIQEVSAKTTTDALRLTSISIQAAGQMPAGYVLQSIIQISPQQFRVGALQMRVNGAWVQMVEA
ncbi:hypothetical protein [Rhizobium binxianense]